MLDIKIKLFESFVDLHTIRIFHGILFPLILLVGCPFVLGVMYYEYYGGDPMKRSLENRLISKMGISFFLYISPGFFGFAWRIFIGPLNEYMAMLNLAVRLDNWLL